MRKLYFMIAHMHILNDVGPTHLMKMWHSFVCDGVSPQQKTNTISADVQ